MLIRSFFIVDCDDIKVYIESIRIRLMYYNDLRRNLMKDDVPRVLGILKVKEVVECNGAEREKRNKIN